MPGYPARAPLTRRSVAGVAALAGLLLAVPAMAEDPQTARADRAAADAHHRVSGIPGLDGSPSDLGRSTPGLRFDAVRPANKPQIGGSQGGGIGGVTGIPGPGTADAARLNAAALAHPGRPRGLDPTTERALAGLGQHSPGGVVTADAAAD